MSPRNTEEATVEVGSLREEAWASRWDVAARYLAILAVCSFVAASFLFLQMRGKIWRNPRTAVLSQIEHVRGYCYFSPLPFDAERGTQSQLLEDDVLLGPARSHHDNIGQVGTGRCSIERGGIWFSTSDNSDPRLDNRRYSLHWIAPLAGKTLSRLTYLTALVTLLSWLIALFAARPLLRKRIREVIREGVWPTPSSPILGSPSFRLASLIFCCALALNLGNFLLRFRDPTLAQHYFTILGVPYSDGVGWLSSSKCVAEGKGLPNGWSSIRQGYSFFTACFFTWIDIGDQWLPLVAVSLNLVICALTAALIYRIGERIYSSRVGVLAAVAFMLHQCLLDYMLMISTEPLGLFFFVLAVHQLCAVIQYRGRLSLFASGVCLGLSNLIRPQTLFVTPIYLGLVLVGQWRSRMPWKRLLSTAIVYAAGIAITIGPWVFRQWMVLGIATVSDNTAEAFYCATSPRFGEWSPAIDQEVPAFKTAKSRYDYFMNKAWENLHSNPGFYLENVRSKFWSSITVSPRILDRTTGLGVLVGLASCILLWRKWYKSWLSLAGAALLLGLVGYAEWTFTPRSKMLLAVGGLLAAPLLGKDRLGFLLLFGALFAVLGVNLFGMAGWDRFALLHEWLFALGYLSIIAWLCQAALGLLPGHADQDHRRSREKWLTSTSAGGVAPVPLWFHHVRLALVVFFLVSGARLLIINFAGYQEPAMPSLLTQDQAAQVLQELDKRFPHLLEGGQRQFMTDFPPDWGAASHGDLVIVPGQVIGFFFALPANVSIPHPNNVFALAMRDYDRTFFYFQRGSRFPKVIGGFPILFPGKLPTKICRRDCLLIGRINNPKGSRDPEHMVVEGLALIPRDSRTGALQFDGAIEARDPRHLKVDLSGSVIGLTGQN
jgi:hypothetical protein